MKWPRRVTIQGLIKHCCQSWSPEHQKESINWALNPQKTHCAHFHSLPAAVKCICQANPQTLVLRAIWVWHRVMVTGHAGCHPHSVQMAWPPNHAVWVTQIYAGYASGKHSKRPTALKIYVHYLCLRWGKCDITSVTLSWWVITGRPAVTLTGVFCGA